MSYFKGHFAVNHSPLKWTAQACSAPRIMREWEQHLFLGIQHTSSWPLRGSREEDCDAKQGKGTVPTKNSIYIRQHPPNNPRTQGGDSHPTGERNWGSKILPCPSGERGSWVSNLGLFDYKVPYRISQRWWCCGIWGKIVFHYMMFSNSGPLALKADSIPGSLQHLKWEWPLHIFKPSLVEGGMPQAEEDLDR